MEPETAKDRRSDILTGLAQHSGAETWFRHWAGTLLFTEGVDYLAKEAHALWLIDNIAWSGLDAKVRHQEFVVWKLSVNADKTATLVGDDGDGHELLRQHVPWTDFPLEEITLYLTDKVLLLTSEY
jgi:hypothetical protein